MPPPDIEYLLKILIFYGHHPYRPYKPLQWFSLLCGATVIFLFFLQFEWKGLETLKDIMFIPLFSMFTGKCIVGILEIDKLKDILDIMEELWPIDKFDNKLKMKCEKHHNRTLLISKIYIYFCAISGFLYCLSCFGTNSILIKVWTFCDYEENYCYYIYGSIETFLNAFIVLTYGCTMDSFFMCSFTHSYTSVEVLKYGMERMVITKKDEESRKNLKEIIRQHQVVLKFYSTLKIYFDLHIFVVFSCGFASLILVLFLMTSDDIIVQIHLVIINMTFCLGTIFKFYIYSYWSSVMNEQILSISDVAFGMDWWEDKNVRRDLVFLIARTQETPYLSAGKLVKVDLDLFISIMKTAFSVYTLLTSFKEIE